MSKLPKQYQWLDGEPGPRVLIEFLKMYGVVETPGSASNKEIMRWAKETGLDRMYSDDSVPWCGLATAYAVLQAGWEPPVNPLWARNWLKFGNEAKVPMLGDILVFSRDKNKGHVGVYVGEDAEYYHVLGGNQSDAVNIKRIAKSRLLGARRCAWRVSQPANVRRVMLASSGVISNNEA